MIPENSPYRHQSVAKMVDLIDPQSNVFLNCTIEQAQEAIASGEADQVAKLRGQFALVHRDGEHVYLARSLGRPLRYFLAKQVAGPCLIVAERMDQIRDYLCENGLEDQFHPSYTRMIPAHHVVTLQLIGCPDPNPQYVRYFTPQQNQLPANRDQIGKVYIGCVLQQLSDWLDQLPRSEPIGLMFSGGIDSGSLLILLNHLLLERGESPSRLKAFTLSLEGGSDLSQARQFVQQAKLEMLLEEVELPATAIDLKETIRIIEDYKPLDVQAAAMGVALCREIRNRYPEWTYLIDGDGGDENLKDYPIEANPELTIRSVLNNLMLYQEGWGVEAIKHSLVFSGGQSRGMVRSYQPAHEYGFQGFSPYALPEVIAVAEGIPFVELTDWSHEVLYRLKGEVVSSGVKQWTGIDLPLFEKCRFQNGAISSELFDSYFPQSPVAYRRLFDEVMLSS